MMYLYWWIVFDRWLSSIVLGTPLWQETNPMFLCRLLVSEIHWVVWALTFGNEATIGYLCHAEIISMAWSPWKNSFVLSHSQRIFSLGPMANSFSQVMSPASPLGSSGMPSHVSQSSRYLYSSVYSSHMEYARVICTWGEMVGDACWIAKDC